jgi:Fur family ferric uptake transcriptional regulator
VAEQTDARENDRTVESLRAQGQRLTPQRLLVLETLRDATTHLTADDLYDLVAAKYPYINRATIYRALAWLKEHGLTSVTDLGGGQLRYQYLAERRHHHLVCLHCGGQQELPDEILAPLAQTLHERYQFAPRLDHFAIFGLCQRCQQQAEQHDPATADEAR